MPEPSGQPSSSLQDLIREGSFGPFYWNDFEFLRRVFVTVRDRNWREVSPSRWQCTVDEARNSIHVSARHTSEDIDFAWSGRLDVSADGCELAFEFEGKALRALQINRLGLVILHPVKMLTGSTLTASEGSQEETTVVDRQIAPQPIVDGLPAAMASAFSSLRIKHAHWGEFEIELQGDQFEMEDQRNWGDDSFKTYCTPLRLGFPRTVNEGELIAHRLRARFRPSFERNIGAVPTAVPEDNPYRSRPLRVGRIAATADEGRADPHWMLGWDHIRVELDNIGADALRELLSKLPRSTTLHLVVGVGDGTALSAARLDLLGVLATRTSAILVKHAARPLPTPEAVAQFRGALKGTGAQGIPLLVVPNGHFVEFNRGMPFDLGVDGIAFPLSPTVHGQDAETILENAQVVRTMVDTGRGLTAKPYVSISPLSLAPSSAGRQPAVSRSVVTAWRALVLAQCQAVGVDAVTLSSDLL